MRSLLIAITLSICTLGARADEIKPDDTFDFKKGIIGGEVQHNFKLLNSGKAPLVIEKVTTSCPCTEVVSFPKTVAPGKSGVIAVVMQMDKVGPKEVMVAAIIEGTTTPRVFVLKGEVWSAP